jgi:hypothetical protein
VLDLHGYVTPTLVEATTKPHNPSIDYDLWLKWNQPRIDALSGGSREGVVDGRIGRLLSAALTDG